MNSMKEFFITEVSIGDRVSVVITNGQEFIGTIDSKKEEIFTIKIDDGRIKPIPYIGIINYDVLDSFSESQPFCDEIESIIKNIEVQNLVHNLDISKLQEEIKKEKGELKKAVSPIVESFSNVIKIKETHFKFGRMEKIIYRINELIKIYPNRKILKELLGEMYFCTEDYNKAQEQFALANKFREAMAAAELSGDRVKQLAYCTRFILDSNSISIDMYNLLFKYTCICNDLSALIVVCMEWEKKLVPESVEILCNGMIYVLSKNTKTITFNDTKLLYSNENFSSLYKQILDVQNNESIENVMTIVRQLHENEDIPDQEKNDMSIDGWRTGKITSYNNKTKFGFIDKTIFFHLNHVIDENLRYRIENYINEKCQVEFRLGTNNQGTCAVDVRINLNLENSINSDTDNVQEYNGFIEYYDMDDEYGKIQSGNNQYGFKLYNISDPYLRAKLKSEFYFKEVDVIFKLNTLPTGKTGACDICANFEFTDEDKRYYDAIIIKEEQRKRNIANRRQFGKSIVIKTNSKNNGYYNQARRISERGGHKEDALLLYQKAIDCLDKPESAVADMVSIYLKNDQPEKAELLLNEHKEILDEDKRNNLFIMVYDKLKKYDKLLPILDKVIQSTDKINTKLHYTFRKAKILSDTTDEYEQAIEAYKQWGKIKNSNKALLGIKGNGTFNPYSNMEVEAKRGMAICYSQLGEDGEAKKIANELIRINKNDELAQAIIENRFSTYILQRESIGTNKNEFISINEDLNDIMVYRLNSFDLVSVLDIRKAKEGRYVGKVEDAVIEIERLEGVSTQEPQKRSRWCLAAAKIITQFIDDEHSEIMQEESRNKLVLSLKHRNDLLAKSLVSDGDYSMLSREVPMDVARFYYLESIKFLESDKQDAQNAVVRYVASYFVDRTDIPISMQGSKNVHINKHINRYFTGATLRGGENFVNACIALFINNATVKKQLIKMIFECEKIKSYTILFLNQMIENNLIDDVYTYDKYCEIWDCAIAQFRNYEKNLKSFMKSLSEFSFNSLWLENALEDMTHLEFIDFMFELEKNRFNKIKQILSNAERYNKATDFETREDTLNEIVTICDELDKEILEHPTKYAFEILLPILPMFRGETKSLLKKLYEDFKPKLSLDLINKNIVVPDGKTTTGLQMCIKNEKNMQAADGLKIVILPNERYSVDENVICKKGYIKGGESETVLHELHLSKQALIEKAFSLNIQLEYNYKNLDDRETQNNQFEFSINLVDDEEFTIINNPYSAYTQSGEVYDPKMFFGRERILDDIVGIIKKSDGELLRKKSIVLFGQKRTGKSSILYHLKNKIRDKSKNSIVVDIGNVAQLITDSEIMRAFQFQLLSKLRDELEDYHSELLNEMEKNKILIPVDEMLDTTKISGALFIEFFNKFNRYVEGRYNIVVLVDEFSYLFSWIEEGKLSNEFMKFWKAIVQSCEIVGILVGQDYMLDFINKYPNEFGSTQSEKITYLSEEAAKQLMDEPITLKVDGNSESRYREGAIERIMDLTAGSAYYIMIICDKLVEYLNEERQIYVTDAYINKLVDKKLLRGNNMLDEAKFDPLYNDEGHINDKMRKEDNIEVLKIIAQKSQKDGKCLITDINSKSIDKERVDLLIESLADRDVIEKVDGKYIRIKVGLYKEWLINRYGGDE